MRRGRRGGRRRRRPTRAVKKTFGDYAKNGLMVSSTKSAHGHLLGASGAVELIVCAKAIVEGVIPATLNLETPGEECDLDYVPKTPRDRKIQHALFQQFRFRRPQRLPDPQTLRVGCVDSSRRGCFFRREESAHRT